MPIELNMKNVTFAQRKISNGWYTGQLRITYLDIHVKIIAIGANAFSADALQYLKDLRINNTLHIIDYHPACFDGLRRLYTLMIDEYSPSPKNPSSNILKPCAKHLESFSYYGDIGSGSVLSTYFGGDQNLSALAFINNDCLGMSKLRMLTAANFTALSNIIWLTLTRCGIQSIELGTFDRIADTLTHLFLIGNPLNDLNVQQFRTFLDRWPKNCPDCEKSLRFSIRTRALNCTSQFYRLRNATIASFGYLHGSVKGLYCVNDVNASTSVQQQQQIIHIKRWHLEHGNFTKYALPKFQLRYNVTQSQFDIEQSEPDSYRLLFWAIDRQTMRKGCPSTTWITTNAKCTRYNQSVQNVNMPGFPRARTIAACIIHISMRKESLPMHCSTIHIDIRDDFPLDWIDYVLFVIVCMAATLLSASCALCVFGKKSVDDDEEPGDEGDVEEDQV